MLHLCQLWFSKLLIELYLTRWLFLEQGGTCWQHRTHKWHTIRKSLGTTAIDELAGHAHKLDRPLAFDSMYNYCLQNLCAFCKFCCPLAHSLIFVTSLIFIGGLSWLSHDDDTPLCYVSLQEGVGVAFLCFAVCMIADCHHFYWMN